MTDQIIGWLLVAASVLALVAAVAAVLPARGESLSERHERLDREAAHAANVAAYESMPKEQIR